MAQEYVLKSFKASDFKDFQGNVWCDAAWEGISEPTKWVMKPETTERIEVGKSYYGEIKDETYKNGNPYRRFHKRKDPEEQPKQASIVPKKEQKEWQPRDDNAIRAQWAIGQAVHYLASGNAPKSGWDVESYAKTLYAMVDRVKDNRPDLDKVDFNTGSQPSHGLRTQEIKEPEPQPAASVPKNVSHNVIQDEEWKSIERALRADGINTEEIPQYN
jgi:hypothetical protein